MLSYVYPLVDMGSTMREVLNRVTFSFFVCNPPQSTRSSLKVGIALARV